MYREVELSASASPYLPKQTPPFAKEFLSHFSYRKGKNTTYHFKVRSRFREIHIPDTECGPSQKAPFKQSCLFVFGHAACRVLVPLPGIKPRPPAVEAQSLNYRTISEVLQ